MLDPDEAQQYIPFSTEGLAGATYGPWDGIIDPHMACLAWVDMAKELGVSFRMNTRVTGLRPEGEGWLVDAGEDRFSCKWIVNAAGAWSGEIGALAGL